MIAVANDDDLGTPQYRTARAAAARFARLREERQGGIKSPDWARIADQVQDNNTEAPQERQLEVLDEFRQLERVFWAAAERDLHAFAVWAKIHIAGQPISAVIDELQISRATLYRRMNKAERNVENCLVERDILRGYAGRDLLHAGGPQAQGIHVWRNPRAHDEDTMKHVITGAVGPDGADVPVDFQIRLIKADRNGRGERWEARCGTTYGDAGYTADAVADPNALLFKRLVYTSKERCVEVAQFMVDQRAEGIEAGTWTPPEPEPEPEDKPERGRGRGAD